MSRKRLRVLVAQHTNVWPIQEDRLREALLRIASDYEYQAGEISLVVVDDQEIRSLNARHLNHDWETDVISFLFESNDRLEGEIIVSAETAHRESSEQPWTGDDELLLYAIHGMLHLMGLEDLDPESAAEMRQEERHYLALFGVDGAEGHGFEFEPH